MDNFENKFLNHSLRNKLKFIYIHCHQNLKLGCMINHQELISHLTDHPKVLGGLREIKIWMLK